MLYDLNPMAGVIEGFRWAVTGTDDPRFLLVLTSTLIVCATLYGGILFFRRMQDTLADVV
jgi:lipopolysaccharide transport system permease protein